MDEKRKENKLMIKKVLENNEDKIKKYWCKVKKIKKGKDGKIFRKTESEMKNEPGKKKYVDEKRRQKKY